MNRRHFLKAGGAAGAALVSGRPSGIRPLSGAGVSAATDDIRSLFPRMEVEAYLNAAGLMPLGSFTEAGLDAYLDYQRLGPTDGRGPAVGERLDAVRPLFAELIGADEAEIGFVPNTKAGEQIVLDGLDVLHAGKNIVTNDLHFSGSLHNLLGMRRAGVDVRIVRAKDWRIDLADVEAAIDDDTGLVTVTLVSNINGHVEDIRRLSELAHARGALLYADIIQAAGIVPIDVREMGIDVAACSSYKWLYGVYGTGFVYVRKELQGARLADRLFPGRVDYDYAPWTSDPDASGELGYHQPDDARRYQTGHVAYQGYCAACDGLRFLREVGVENALAHSVALNRRLLEGIDPKRYACITPDVERVPFVTFLLEDPDAVRDALRHAGVIVSITGNRMRVSPALYNNEDDIDRLLGALPG